MSLFKQVTDKPWERKGVIGGLDPVPAFNAPSEKVALAFFLVVVAVVFSLFTVGYLVRMELPDWRPLSEPAQLWFNTGLLLVSSVLFQWARTIARRESHQNLMTAFVGAGLFAFLFIASQLVIWNNLQDAGYYMTSNPANAFYYLMTGLHAVHLLGGLWVWSKTLFRLLAGTEVGDVRLSIDLCSLYWHFLLVVWLVLFALLANT